MKTRLIAAALHFLASAFVISIALSIVYFVWYPAPFYKIHSVFDAVKIALVVDLILGPFLTLVIFNVLKPRKELVRDIAIIVLFQISALSWGLHITHKMRPMFLVFQGETFYTIIKKDIDLGALHENIQPPAIWQSLKPVYVEKLSSEAVKQRLEVILSGGKIEGDMYQSGRYRPLTMQMDNAYMQDILHKATSYKILLKSMTWGDQVKKFLKDKNGKGENYLFYSMENPGTFSGIIIFNKKNFSYAGLME